MTGIEWRIFHHPAVPIAAANATSRSTTARPGRDFCAFSYSRKIAGAGATTPGSSFFPAAVAVAGISEFRTVGDGASGDSAATTRCEISANRFSSSGFMAARISSARRFKLRTSLSLKPYASAEKASSKPTVPCADVIGTATMERVPRRRQTCKSTRGSFSESSHRTISPVRRQAPENREFGSSRTPASSAMVPAEARQTIAFSSAIAMAMPSAPVRVSARSATSCNTSSRTNCSSSQTSAGSDCAPRFSLARRSRICSCRLEKARRACRAS